MSDTLSAIEPPSELTRRETLVRLGVGSFAVAACGACVFGYRFLSPNVLYEPSTIVNLGKPAAFSAGSFTADPESGIYAVHATEGFYSLSAVCTHLGCLTVWKPDAGIIACPCHGSKFDRHGVKLEGPAPKPLPWLKVWLSDEGDLMVDRSVFVPPNQYLRT